MKTTLFLFFILFSLSSLTQIIDEAYYSDLSPGYLDRVISHIELEDGMIISGIMLEASTVEPVVLRLNLNGEVLWSTADNFLLGTTQCSGFKIELFDDGFIYGRSSEYIWPNDNKTLWKIDVATGEVIWTNLFFGTYFNRRTNIADYDSTSYLVSSYGITGQPALSIVDKTTGDTLQTRYIGTGQGEHAVTVDQNKNIYYAYGSKLYKFNGNDLDQIIWSRQYISGVDPLDDIHTIYLDPTENVFLLGRNDAQSLGEPIVARVNPMTGELLWKVETINDEVTAADFVDDFGNLFITYRHSLVGSGPFYFTTVKVNKTNGVVLWQSQQNMTVLATLPSNTGEGEAALSIDLDCNANPYLTGYYGDANYGPEMWGIMKLSGVAGTKIYDQTIVIDSTTYDNLSSGIGVSVFGDSPVFVGNLENNQGETDAWYVTIEPGTGTPVIRKKIGGAYQQSSATKDILNVNDSMYVLKQQGRSSVVEMYDANGNLIWSKTFADSSRMTAGQISVSGNFLFLTLAEQAPNANPPFYSESVETLKLYRLSRFNGGTLNTHSLAFPLDTVELLELETEVNNAFLFYRKNSQVYSLKWSLSGFSSEEFIEAASSNTSYKGRLNIVADLNSTSLLYAGKSSLYQIDKSSFTITNVANYPNTRNNYDLRLSSGILYLVGGNDSGTQQLTSIDTLSFSENWSQSYELGTFHGVRFRQNDTLYVYGVKGDSANVVKMDINGAEIWNYSRANAILTNGSYQALELYPNWDLMLVGGSETTIGQSSNSVLTMLNEDGNEVWSSLGEDEIGSQSFATLLENQNDSIIWAGGALNRITYNKEGFVYQIIPDSFLTTPDCYGIVGGTAYLDSCGVCVDGMTGQIPCIQDCNSDWGGIAFIDSCSICAGGNTGMTPILNPIDCVNSIDELNGLNLVIHPNPASQSFSINGITSDEYSITLTDLSGKIVLTRSNESVIDVSPLAQGAYIVQLQLNDSIYKLRVLVVN